MGGVKDAAATEMAMLWILNLSDGRHDLLDIAVRSGIPFYQISQAADAASKCRPVGSPSEITSRPSRHAFDREQYAGRRLLGSSS